MFEEVRIGWQKHVIVLQGPQLVSDRERLQPVRQVSTVLLVVSAQQTEKKYTRTTTKTSS